jgi:hypothetical protein
MLSSAWLQLACILGCQPALPICQPRLREMMGADGGFITGSDFLMDGGVTASYWYGDVAEVRGQQ